MDTPKKKLYLVIAAVVVIGIFSFPYLKTAYKKHKANDLLIETNAAHTQLNSKIAQGVQLLQDNFSLLTAQERKSLQSDIDAAKHGSLRAEYALTECRRLFTAEDYDAVRRKFDKTFDLGEKERREVPLDYIKPQDENMQAVISFCTGKRDKRNRAFNNELYLKACLKKPYSASGFEHSDDFAILPDSMRMMVPASTPELCQQLSQFPPELNNCMGWALLAHQPALAHIHRFGKTPSIKSRAQGYYDSAFNSYRQVKAKNDALPFWYRPQAQDGKLTMQDYDKFLAQQQAVLDLVYAGNNSLTALDKYLAELHNQYYVYVSDHTHERTTFHHTRLVPATDSDGDFCLKTEHYTSTGYKYYYTLTTVTPAGSSHKLVYVGEIDSLWRSWSYASEEQIGYVRAWKRLHYDDTQILSGVGLQPALETVPQECR